DDLLQTVWPDTFITEETLTQNIATIRRALGDSAEHPEYIATVPRRGYQFIGLVRQASGDGKGAVPAPEVLDVRPVGPGGQANAWTRRQVFLIGIAALAVLLSVGFVVLRYWRSGSAGMPVSPSWPVTAPVGTTVVSNGVLSPDGKSIAFVTTE